MWLVIIPACGAHVTRSLGWGQSSTSYASGDLMHPEWDGISGFLYLAPVTYAAWRIQFLNSSMSSRMLFLLLEWRWMVASKIA